MLKILPMEDVATNKDEGKQRYFAFFSRGGRRKVEGPMARGFEGDGGMSIAKTDTRGGELILARPIPQSTYLHFPPSRRTRQKGRN